MQSLGTNRGTTIVGWVLLFSGAIAIKPDLVDFVPEPWKAWIVGISTLVAFAAGGTFVTSVKGRNVTGGSIAATNEAKNRLTS